MATNRAAPLPVRAAAAIAIARVIRDGVSLNTALAEGMPRVVPRDQGLLQELCYGTLRWYPRLRLLVGALLAKPLKAADADIAALLACALYQLTWTRMPAHAAVNETVATCAALGKPWAKGLANAVLRRFGRERETLEAALADDPEYQSAHPRWLADSLRAAWPAEADALFAANNGRAPMTLRVNLRKTRREDYLQALASAGIGALPTASGDAGIQLTAAVAVSQLPGFDKGLLSVQDEAAQLAAILLDLAPGQRVLDACCAPGGKTGHIFEREPGVAELVAIDSDASRLQRVRDNLQRLGLSATLRAADARNTSDWWDGEPFARILLDAPCSGSGVIRRHPDIKLLRTATDITQLAALQLELLNRLWPLLAPGGKLLYATCSVLPAENDDVIAQFAAARTDVDSLPIAIGVGCASTCGRQLLPQLDGHDGFYYALLQKRE
ncbi:MAG: 16S rRNA (cytosine(967)-C(5))-methyltransferase RsmB [Porticoccaceae bacterium]